MPTVDINDLGVLGVIRDTPAYQLPPEAWTIANNMRTRGRAIEGLLGWSEIFPGAVWDPHFALLVSTASQVYYLYMSLEKAGVWDGNSHADATRAVGGDYSATETRQINGTLLGDVAILNNGVDIPQMWAPADITTNCANLTNWPSTKRAALIRSFQSHLIAFDITESGTRFPHLVQWSSAAEPGSIPSSWDVTDPTVDTGEKDLTDINSGVIVDALPLGTSMFIYKEKSTWRMRYIGGRFVWAWDTLLEGSGILAPRCVASTPDGTMHFVVTQDDIIVHDGTAASVRSVLNERQREDLFNSIDTQNYLNCFVFANPSYSEMWFCYPSQGQEHPDRALIWKYEKGKAGAITEADGITFRNALSGLIEQPDEEGWEDTEEEWEEDTGPWAQLERQRTILLNPADSKFMKLDSGTSRDGVTFTCMLQREALAVIGRKRGGDWIVDFQQMKLMNRIWPKIQGGPVAIRGGSQQTVNGAVAWGSSRTFDPATSMELDLLEEAVGEHSPCSGRALSLEFSAPSTQRFRLDGYKYDLTLLGEF